MHLGTATERARWVQHRGRPTVSTDALGHSTDNDDDGDDHADGDDDHVDDSDDDDNDGDDTDLFCAKSHADEAPLCKSPSAASKRGQNAEMPLLTALYTARRREAPLAKALNLVSL